MHDAAARGPRGKHIDQGSGSKILVDHHRRQLHHANPVQGGKPHLDHVVGDETRVVRNNSLCTIGAFQAPLVLAVRRAKVEARQRCEVGWHDGACETGQQVRAGDQPLRARRQYAHDEIALFQRRKPNANRKVEIPRR